MMSKRCKVCQKPSTDTDPVVHCDTCTFRVHVGCAEGELDGVKDHNAWTCSSCVNERQEDSETETESEGDETADRGDKPVPSKRVVVPAKGDSSESDDSSFAPDDPVIRSSTRRTGSGQMDDDTSRQKATRSRGTEPRRPLTGPRVTAKKRGRPSKSSRQQEKAKRDDLEPPAKKQSTRPPNKKRWCVICKDEDTDNLIPCSSCSGHYHLECVPHRKLTREDTSFVCDDCEEMEEIQRNETQEQREERSKLERSLKARNQAIRDLRAKGAQQKRRTLFGIKDQVANFVEPALMKRMIGKGNASGGDAPETITIDREDTSFVNATLRPYQFEGVEWLLKQFQSGVGGILADEMGLGKTIQTLAFLSYLKTKMDIPGPHLVIVPLAVLHNWGSEVARFTDLSFCKIYGTRGQMDQILSRQKISDGEVDIYLTTYETCVSMETFFTHGFEWQTVIIDEGHRLKNEKSALAGSISRVKSTFRLLVTGTPLQNNLHELWSLLNFLMPELFQDPKIFDEASEAMQTNDGEEDATHNQVLLQARQLLDHFLLRRIKVDVMPDFPPKVKKDIFVPLSKLQVKMYQNVFRANKMRGAASPAMSTRKLFQKLQQLRKICNHPKILAPGAKENPDLLSVVGGAEALEQLAGLTGDELINASGKLSLLDLLLQRLYVEKSRVLIFSQFTQTLDVLEQYVKFRKWSYKRLDGSTNRVMREMDMRQFNAPGSDDFLYLISTAAGGQGLNLASADIVVLYDLNWNPHADLQAEDRAHRIGQKKTVRVYRLISQSTVEEKVREKAQQKLILSAMVVSKKGAIPDANLKKNAGDNLSANELRKILKYGADRVFALKGIDRITEEDMDDILKSSADKVSLDETKDWEDMLKSGDFNGLLMKLDMDSRAEAEGAEQENAGDDNADENSDGHDGEGNDDNDKSATDNSDDGSADQKDKAVDESNDGDENPPKKTATDDGKTGDTKADATKPGEDPKKPTNEPEKTGRGHRERKPTRHFCHDDYEPKKKRATREPYIHEHECFVCDDGGLVMECTGCPKVYHPECVGFDEDNIPKGAWRCGWHSCRTCNRTSSEGGGIMFRCMHCPKAYCFDCLDAERKVEVAVPDPMLLDDLKRRNFNVSTTMFILCDNCKVDAARKDAERRRAIQKHQEAEALLKEWEEKRQRLEEEKEAKKVAAEKQKTEYMMVVRELIQMRVQEFKTRVYDAELKAKTAMDAAQQTSKARLNDIADESFKEILALLKKQRIKLKTAYKEMELENLATCEQLQKDVVKAAEMVHGLGSFTSKLDKETMGRLNLHKEYRKDMNRVKLQVAREMKQVVGNVLDVIVKSEVRLPERLELPDITTELASYCMLFSHDVASVNSLIMVPPMPGKSGADGRNNMPPAPVPVAPTQQQQQPPLQWNHHVQSLQHNWPHFMNSQNIAKQQHGQMRSPQHGQVNGQQQVPLNGQQQVPLNGQQQVPLNGQMNGQQQHGQVNGQQQQHSQMNTQQPDMQQHQLQHQQFQPPMQHPAQQRHLQQQHQLQGQQEQQQHQHVQQHFANPYHQPHAMMYNHMGSPQTYPNMFGVLPPQMQGSNASGQVRSGGAAEVIEIVDDD